MENKTYFAAADEEHIIDELNDKIREFYADLSAEGLMDLTQKLHKAYYGGDLTEHHDDGLFASSKIKEEGRLGYLKKYKANHFRNVVRHILQLATSQRINYSPQATNSDYKSLTQTVLSKGILEHYLVEERLEKKYKQALETALVLLEGWVHIPWDETAGELFDTVDGVDVTTGDIKAEVYSLLDVVRDITTEGDNHNWLMVRTFENRYDLAATYPMLAEDILGEEMVDNHLEGYESFRSNLRSTQESDDQVVVWIFYHKPTPAMPNGRVVQFCGDTLLLDAPFPYAKIPLLCVKEGGILGTPYGYSSAADVLGPQKALDIVNTQAATNQFNLGVQNVWSRSGQTPNIKDLADGMTLWESPEKPEPLILAQINQETFTLKEGYERDIELISGVNSTVRGNPPGANMSGAAQALLVSQSVSFNGALEASYFEMVAEAGTMIIKNLQKFAETPRIISIMGESKRPYTQEFVSEDISEITRVRVDVGNPLARTPSGRIEMARLMQEMGLQITPYQLLNIMETGSLQSAVEGSQNEYLTIKAENEMLRVGQMVPVMFTDNHPEHINEHKAILSDPESRRDPQLVQSVLTHIQEHLDVWRNTDPSILQVLGIPPVPPPPEMGMPPEGEQGPPPQGGPNQPPAGPGPQESENMPNQPDMPEMPEGAPPEAQAAYDQRKGQ